jgi:hypothetical protein
MLICLSTHLWNQFPVNDQKLREKVFAGLNQVSKYAIK